MSFTTIILLSVFSQQSPVQNITQCQEIYHNKIITPLGINFIPLNSLKKFIRYYNFKTFRRIVGNSKSQRRKLRTHYHKNYYIYSHSAELDYMPNLCEIQYDKLNIKEIKSKYQWTKFHVESQRMNDTFVISSLLVILSVLFMLMCTS